MTDPVLIVGAGPTGLAAAEIVAAWRGGSADREGPGSGDDVARHRRSGANPGAAYGDKWLASKSFAHAG